MFLGEPVTHLDRRQAFRGIAMLTGAAMLVACDAKTVSRVEINAPQIDTERVMESASGAVFDFNQVLGTSIPYELFLKIITPFQTSEEFATVQRPNFENTPSARQSIFFKGVQPTDRLDLNIEEIRRRISRSSEPDKNKSTDSWLRSVLLLGLALTSASINDDSPNLHQEVLKYLPPQLETTYLKPNDWNVKGAIVKVEMEKGRKIKSLLHSNLFVPLEFGEGDLLARTVLEKLQGRIEMDGVSSPILRDRLKNILVMLDPDPFVAAGKLARYREQTGGREAYFQAINEKTNLPPEQRLPASVRQYVQLDTQFRPQN